MTKHGSTAVTLNLAISFTLPGRWCYVISLGIDRNAWVELRWCRAARWGPTLLVAVAQAGATDCDNWEQNNLFCTPGV